MIRIIEVNKVKKKRVKHMNKYNYPDEGDKITTILIEEKSDNKYWEESERNVLDIMIEDIRKMPNKPKFLDLGCGTGRLFSVFYPYVENIIGVEPDLERFNKSKNEAEKINSEK